MNERPVTSIDGLPWGFMAKDLQRVRFPARHSFHTDLVRRVEQYFEGTGRSRHGGWMIGAKAAALIAWLAASTPF